MGGKEGSRWKCDNEGDKVEYKGIGVLGMTKHKEKNRRMRSIR